ncbi:MAG: hypothetical protein ACI9E1_002434 [Cryomorphaceae bacterium]|jgi:hypothetical protein
MISFNKADNAEGVDVVEGLVGEYRQLRGRIKTNVYDY